MKTSQLFQFDGQQSIVGDGQLVRSYSPYGVLPVVIGPRLAYCGMACEALMGTYHLGNGCRTYSPALMRFHSPDRLSPFGEGGTNTYAYCRGDPINYRDPSGQTLISAARGFLFAKNVRRHQKMAEGGQATWVERGVVVLAGLSDLAGIGWDKLKDFYGVDPYLSAEEMIPGLEDYYKTAKVVDLTVMGVEAFLNVAGFIAFRRSEGRVNNQRQNEGGDTASNSSVGESLSATTKLIADARANTA